MIKIIIAIVLSSLATSLYAKENIFISPKVALKMIDKKEILFLTLDKKSLKIKKSKKIDSNLLISTDILGYQACEPLYICANKVEKYFSNLGIEPNQALVIYDDSYGINAATLYVVLESMGHKNITILRGGANSISELDPNLKTYNKYLAELRALLFLKDNLAEINDLKKKISILKPHLLLEKSNIDNVEVVKSDYKVEQTDLEYLLSKRDLKKAVKKVQNKESNITIVDACEMIDIVGSNNASYLPGVKSLSWKNLINKKEKRLKSNEALANLLDKLELNKMDSTYVYCMSSAQKAFFVMMALREVGYTNVKAFSGDWNVWAGDIDE